jgi:hypothetical protein
VPRVKKINFFVFFPNPFSPTPPIERKKRGMRAQEVSKKTGLSHYLLTVLYDFHAHKLGLPDKRRESLMVIRCGNPEVVSFHGLKKSMIKEVLSKRLKEMGKEGMEKGERDLAMVHEFTGWGLTSGGHWTYIYYRGPDKHTTVPDHWRILHKDLLPYFHTRFGKSLTPELTQMNALDFTFTEDGHNNLCMDARFIVNRWMKAKQNLPLLEMVKENIHLFAKGPDYLIKPIKREMKQEEVEEKPRLKKRRVKESVVLIKEELDDDLDDPFEVKDEALRYVTNDEFTKSSFKFSLDPSITFDFPRFQAISRTAFISTTNPKPPSFYEHDPVNLFDAVAIATNMESFARTTGAVISLGHQKIVENDNTSAVIDYFANNPRVTEEVKDKQQEYLFALLATENATRNPPPPIEMALQQKK